MTEVDYDKITRLLSDAVILCSMSVWQRAVILRVESGNLQGTEVFRFTI